jgi:hypothetical protein
MIRGIFEHENKSLKTDLNAMFTFALNMIKKRRHAQTIINLFTVQNYVFLTEISLTLHIRQIL